MLLPVVPYTQRHRLLCRHPVQERAPFGGQAT